MRYQGLLLAVFFSFSCFAQKKARIVFFRMDIPIGPESSAFKEVRNFTDVLRRNEQAIGNLRSPSVFIFEPDSISGSYYLAPKAGTHPETEKATINQESGSIAFIRISIGDVEQATCYAEVLHISEFKEYYDNAKWLRNKLSEKGFKSLEQLTRGYEPMPLKPRSYPRYNFAQKIKRSLADTTFLGTFDIPADRNTARVFSVATKDADGSTLVTDYYAATGKIKMAGHYASLDSESKTGTFTEYYPSGHLMSIGAFKDNMRDGKWMHYYDTANQPLWYECTYDKGYETGALRSYYPDGKIKRIEEHLIFSDTVEYGPRKARKSFVRKKDSITSGQCFDEAGQTIEFTPFEKMAHPPFEINTFLAKHVRYPDSAREHDIEGRVILRFTVDEKGTIQDLTVMKGVSEDINREAINAVRAMPPWNPGVRDDKPASVVFTLPITFKLE